MSRSMNKLLLAGVIIAIVLGLQKFHLIYFPLDILNLLSIFHNSNSFIPHNSLVSDPVFQFEPWRVFAKEQLLRGQFPLWNDLNAGGVPLFANSQSAVLFPLNYLYYILPVSISLNLIVLLKFMLLFIFSRLYIKSIGISEKVSILGSFCVCFAGFPLVWILWPHTNVYIFLPLFLYLTEKISQTNRNSHRQYVFLALAYFFAILGGHYETLVHLMLLHIPYLLFRLYSQKKKLIHSLIFIFFGFMAASIQLLPFLEYFLLSYAFAYRVHSQYLVLPIQSIVQNFIPFILGAPHLKFYQPITATTNFQEAIGGYTGLVVLLVSFIGSVALLNKNKLLNFWIASSVFFWFLTFKIWPIGLLLNLPILSQAQNSRISAIAAFSTIMIFIFSIEKFSFIIKKKKRIMNTVLLGAISLLIGGVILCVIFANFTNIQAFKHPFINTLILHLIFLIITTTTFYLLLHFKRNSGVFVSLLTLVVLLQTLFLLGNYVPFVNTVYYYPVTSVVKKLQGINRGTILEVGNPSILPDINLMYGISQAQNYDGIEVKKYKEAFDNAFPIINHWGKVEKVSLKSLQEFGINYVLSDYNINDTYQPLQDKFTSILGPLDKSYSPSITFSLRNKNLSSVRILPANYNRKNSCSMFMEVIEKSTGTRVFKTKITCNEMLDKMFYDIAIENSRFEYGHDYVIRFSTDGTKKDSIGLWGDKGKPFVQLYYSVFHTQYEYIGTYDGINLFRVPNSQPINIEGQYRILHQTNTSLLLEYNASVDQNIVIKKTFYPGWNAYIDGKKMELIRRGPFMDVKSAKGHHVLKIVYEPLSFLVGFIFSFCSLLIMAIYFLRNEFRQKWLKNTSKIIQARICKLFISSSWLTSSAILLVFLIGGLVIFLVPLSYLPLHNSFEFTTSVNWLTVNHHALKKDYLIVGLFILIVPVSLLTGLMYLLWRRKK